MNTQQATNTVDELTDEDFLATYGTSESNRPAQKNSNINFQPWHHPVKQIVRTKQWLALTKKLITEHLSQRSELRYFTLPGIDLLDVRTLAQVCHPLGVKIDYFGFNSSSPNNGQKNNNSQDTGEFLYTESALLQSGHITPSAEILPDRLEDIAIPLSQAAVKLEEKAPFDIINLDICDHLAYIPKGREVTAFDALQSLLSHQLRAKNPWLLFITTRAEPQLLGSPGMEFSKAIMENLSVTGSGFKDALTACLNLNSNNLATELHKVWSTNSTDFLKLFTIGFGKFLLQFFHSQPSLPANVELVSSYTYRVHNDVPDMLAMAFRITPEKIRTFPIGTKGVAVFPDLEPTRAVYVANQAKKMWDIDEALDNQADIRITAIRETEELLRSASYNIPAWHKWLADHKTRPIQI